MVRGKVQLRHIKNPVHRHVTFCKRRGGLLKKAKELSVLCEVEIGIIIFSAQGKLYEQTTSGTMENLIQRYKKTCGDSQVENGEASQAQEMQRDIIAKTRERLSAEVPEVGRMAGQFAKQRSNPFEERDGVKISNNIDFQT